MSKITLNISKENSNGIVSAIEKDKYFDLNKNETTRAELYAFAIAAAMAENKAPEALQNIDTLVRVSYLGDYETLLSSLFFFLRIKDDTDQIDTICDRDEVYVLAEQYANSGFKVLKEWHEKLNEEALFYKLIGYMDKQYEDIENELTKILQ